MKLISHSGKILKKSMKKEKIVKKNLEDFFFLIK